LLGSGSDADVQQGREIFQSLAQERSFYGFLAADALELPYNYEDAPETITHEQVHALEETPGVQRSLELFALGEMTRARREWRFTTQDFSNIELRIAARVAEKWGWHNQAIRSMITAKAWDDLAPRFPLAYQDNFIAGSRTEDIPVTWSMAIARQESAFMPDAKSSAGALGLMQLMPATARQVAKESRISLRSNNQLTDPPTNIKLGTAYLGKMFRQFNHNRILASAAYNAGPNRVKNWLDPSLPLDVWIETIPFSETRKYVQNVLVFSSIYSRKLDQREPLIFAHERRDFSNPELSLIGP
jgi:soluble lytic murein transglycosylase